MKFGKRLINFGTSFLLLTEILTICAGPVAAQEKQHKQSAKLAKQAKISPEKARLIAQAREPSGTIEDSELEKEHGKLVYSFDIRNEKGTITEVQIDAQSGQVVSVEEENKQAEEKEKQKDAKKKRN